MLNLCGVLTTFLLTSSFASSNRELNRTCNASNPCSASLTYPSCEKGFCVCPEFSQLSWNAESNVPECLTYLNGRCGDGIKCPKNSACSKHKFCGPLFKLGDDCEANSQCDSYKRLQCLGGKCSCPDTVIVDNYDSGCKIKAGDTCRWGSDCVGGARCETPRGGTNGTCKCAPNSKPGSDGLCYGLLGSRCNYPYGPCDEGLACVDYQCKCLFRAGEAVPNDTNCFAALHSPCEKTDEAGKKLEFSCADKFAECRKGSGSGTPQCACKEGYLESKSGACKAGNGTTCEINPFQEACDTSAGLRCDRDRVCRCPKLQAYDGRGKTCQKGLAGARCKGNEFCVDGAFCKMFRDPLRAKQEGGVCLCKEPKKASKDRRCT